MIFVNIYKVAYLFFILIIPLIKSTESSQNNLRLNKKRKLGFENDSEFGNEICDNDKILNNHCQDGYMKWTQLDEIKNFLLSQPISDENIIIITKNIKIHFSSIESQLNSNIKDLSSIDFDLCEFRLKLQLGMPLSKPLYIFKVDILTKKNKTPYVFYQIFQPGNTTPLSLDICKDKIIINTPIFFEENMKKIYQNLNEEGIDMINSEDDFYHDICKTFTTIYDTDITINDRRKYYFKENENIYFCQKGCTFDSFDYNNNKAICFCNASSEEMNTLDENNFFENKKINNNFYDEIDNINFKVMKCTDEAFSSNYKKNIGGIIMACIALLVIIFNIISIFTCQKKIDFYISVILEEPSKKEDEKHSENSNKKLISGTIIEFNNVNIYNKNDNNKLIIKENKSINPIKSQNSQKQEDIKKKINNDDDDEKNEDNKKIRTNKENVIIKENIDEENKDNDINFIQNLDDIYKKKQNNAVDENKDDKKNKEIIDNINIENNIELKEINNLKKEGNIEKIEENENQLKNELEHEIDIKDIEDDNKNLGKIDTYLNIIKNIENKDQIIENDINNKIENNNDNNKINEINTGIIINQHFLNKNKNVQNDINNNNNNEIDKNDKINEINTGFIINKHFSNNNKIIGNNNKEENEINNNDIINDINTGFIIKKHIEKIGLIENNDNNNNKDIIENNINDKDDNLKMINDENPEIENIENILINDEKEKEKEIKEKNNNQSNDIEEKKIEMKKKEKDNNGKNPENYFEPPKKSKNLNIHPLNQSQNSQQKILSLSKNSYDDIYDKNSKSKKNDDKLDEFDNKQDNKNTELNNQREDDDTQFSYDPKVLSDYELDNLDYQTAIESDKRSYCSYYWSLCKRKNILLYTFWPRNCFNILIIKIVLFIAFLGFCFGINGFFYTEKVLHKLYTNKGTYKFWSHLPHIIYSTIVSGVLTYLLRLLTVSENEIYKMKKNANNKIEEGKKCIKIKLILFFILSVILTAFFWYFITCFCAIFHNSQIFYIIDSCITIGFCLVYPFILNLLPGAFRIPALRAKNKDKSYLYEISLYISYI